MTNGPREQRSDPDARFSFANERTFLAWGRTCMAMVATGLAIAKFFGEGSTSDLPLISGIALIVVGGLLAAWSYANYRRNDEAIRARTPMQRSMLPLVLLLTIAAAAVVAVVLSLTA
jgi:putative membrane protein